jgi:hypothetical protein
MAPYALANARQMPPTSWPEFKTNRRELFYKKVQDAKGQPVSELSGKLPKR